MIKIATVLMALGCATPIVAAQAQAFLLPSMASSPQMGMNSPLFVQIDFNDPSSGKITDQLSNTIPTETLFPSALALQASTFGKYYEFFNQNIVNHGKLNVRCSNQFLPVCGGNRTYTNICEAGRARLRSVTIGSCESARQSMNLLGSNLND